MKVAILGEFSGAIRDAFIAKGHEAISCDLLPSEKLGPHYQGDMFDLIDFPWDLAVFHIPCTDSSVSGAAWFREKKLDGRFYKGNALWLNAWRRASHIPKVCFEHPVSVIASLFRKPDQVIQPYQFGHAESKATCLWLRGLPLLTPTNVVALPPQKNKAQRLHYLPPSPTRAKERSRTFAGIAQAMADQWT